MSAIVSSEGRLSPEILEAAARWYVQLQENSHEDERRAWQQWLNADVRHRQAWAQMESLERRLLGVPADIVRPTISGARAQRRRVTTVLTLLMGTGLISTLVYQNVPWQQLQATYRTRTGETRRLRLADGGTVDINTASAVDIDYQSTHRIVRLHRGEILIRTGVDPLNRPFEVHTQHGSVRALGTYFNVRTSAQQTRVSVLEHAVELRSFHGEVRRLEAGQQADYGNELISDVTHVDPNLIAWHAGKLIVIDQRLGAFIQELARYRKGYLACDPAVADLRISGAFRLFDTDAILANLTASLPVKVVFLTRYWARIEPR